MNNLTHNHYQLLCHLENAAVENNGIADPKQCKPELLKDLEDAKLFKNMGLPTQPLVHLTIDGWKVTQSLRQHKAHGGTLNTFVTA